MKSSTAAQRLALVSALLAVPLTTVAAPISSATVVGGGNARWLTYSGSLINDGHINGSAYDSYDGTLMTVVNGSSHNPGSNVGTVDLVGNTVTGQVSTMSGLQVQEQVYFDTLTATARMFVSFTNAGSSAITFNLGSYTNMGSDGFGVTSATSSGNTVFDGADRWMISADNSTGDAVTAYVMQGTGTVAADMLSVSGSAQSGAWTGEYSLTVGAGQTASMLYFTQMYATVSAAQSGMAAFDNLTVGSTLLAGLTNSQLASVKNWNFATNDVPEPGSLALTGLALLGLAAARRRRGV